ncbi:MAG TPA: response regulator transcription factor [Sphingomonas sp.]|nr:response regulator transcription factor [Sphingomonas sp.]
MRVLVVEDDPVVGLDLARALSDADFVVDLSIDGADAWFRGDVEDYACVVLDLGLPRLDGLSVLKRWRASGRAFPVLILSARSDWTEKVEGIEAGADDYVGKPFAVGEVVARARSLVRRAAGHSSPLLSIGRLTLDTARMSVTADGRTLRLSPLEYRLLDLLVHRPGRFLSTMDIAEQLHGTADAAEANAIEALVLRLRRKVGADAIESRRGFGYMLAGS